MDTLDYIADSIRPAWRPPFRGQIHEYAGKLNLQNGYAVKGLIEMATLRHLIEPLMAIWSAWVRIVSIIGAVQTTKSLLLDILAAYIVEHCPGDTLWLLEDDPKAKLYAERALGLLCSVPEIAAMLEGVDRSDRTKTQIKFAHMKLLMCGLNPGNVQSLTWKNVFVDETWLHPFDGLIRQAMDRAKQYPDNKKIILIGQGGVEDDDHSQEHKQTDQRVLHYSCPECGSYQPFELRRERPEDFKLQPPWRSPGALPSNPGARPGTHSGLAWDTNDQTHPNGRWNYDLVGATGHHLCYHCNFRIEDRPEVRRALNDSYAYFPDRFPEPKKIELGINYQRTHQVPFINSRGEAFAICHLPSAIVPIGISTLDPGHRTQDFPMFPERVGFQWPAEASIRVTFRELVTKYLRAKTSAEELAYRLPLQEYYQKDRGLTWNDVVEAEYRNTVQETYDVHAEWSEEGLRVLTIDCQRDLQKFFYSVYASALTGEARELARGQAASFDELAAIQKLWKVKDHHTIVDVGYQMTKVLRECVKRGHEANVKRGKGTVKMWLCWIGMKGSGAEFFTHTNPRTQVKESKLYSVRKFYNVNIGTSAHSRLAPWYEWSNLHVKDLLRDRRDADPSAPKFLFLPDTLPATDQNSHFAQMRSEKRVERWTARGKRSIWELVKETRPNHPWDYTGQFIAFQAIAGIIGTPDRQEEPAAT